MVVIVLHRLNIFMKRTYQPKKKKRAKTHGFHTRTKTLGGKKTILRRIRKGRKKLTP